jgi:hypothetical protein
MCLGPVQADHAPSRAFRFIVGLAIAITTSAASSSRADNVQPDPVIVLPHDIVLPVPAMPSTNADPMNSASPGDVLTQRYNNLRTGTTFQNKLTRDTVEHHFGYIGVLGSTRLEDTEQDNRNAITGVVTAQPLFVENVAIQGQLRSVVIIATSANMVYAFDADSLDKIWGKPLGTPFTVSNDLDKNSPEGQKNCNMVVTQKDGHAELGIDSTPVIDLRGPKPRIIVSYRRINVKSGELPIPSGGDGAQYIAALDFEGNILQDRRITDEPSFKQVLPNHALFDQLHRNRASLLLDGDLVYVAFAARCEVDTVGNPDSFFAKKSYQGWIFAFNSDDLSFAGLYRSTPQTQGVQEPSDDPIAGSGIWQATTGLAADGHGNLYFATGNQYRCSVPADANNIMCSPPDPAGKNLSNSIIRLHVDPSPGGVPRSISMTPNDWFTPYRKAWLDAVDLDFASAGVVLIPNTKYLVAGGKDGMMYVLDRGHLGKVDGMNFDDATILSADGHTSGEQVGIDNLERDIVVQKFQAAQNQYCALRPDTLYCGGSKPGPGVATNNWFPWPHIHGTPVFGAFPDGRAFLYLWAEKDFLKSFRWWGRRFDTTGKVATGLEEGKVALAPPHLQGGSIGMPGGMLSLSIGPDPTKPPEGVLFASVQRCQLNENDSVWHECDVDDCRNSNPSHCAEQRYGMLRAFDPFTLRELWNNQTDPFVPDPKLKSYYFIKFVPPTIAHNRVFLPTASRRVLVYGLQ